MLRMAQVTPHFPSRQLPFGQQRQIKRTIQRTYATWRGRFPRWANSGFDESFLLHDALPLLKRMLAGEQPADPAKLVHQWVAASGIPEAHVRRVVSEMTPVAADFVVHLQLEYCALAA